MSSIPLPNTYGRIAIDAPQGGIGSVMDPTLAGIKRNLDAISSSINQTVTAIQSLDAKDDALDAAISALKASVSEVESDITVIEANIGAMHEFVKLTAENGGSTWNLADLPGYPYIRSVIVDPSTESNILNLPALGTGDRMVVSVKVTTGPGSLTIDGGASDIIPIAAMGVGSTYGIPVTKLEGSLRVTEYGVTLLWAGSEWQIIENSVYIS